MHSFFEIQTQKYTIMKQIETIKSGKNFTAVTAGTFAEIIEHELPMGPDFTLKGKVFLGQALGATGAELSYQTADGEEKNSFALFRIRRSDKQSNLRKVCDRP